MTKEFNIDRAIQLDKPHKNRFVCPDCIKHAQMDMDEVNRRQKEAEFDCKNTFYRIIEFKVRECFNCGEDISRVSHRGVIENVPVYVDCPYCRAVNNHRSNYFKWLNEGDNREREGQKEFTSQCLCYSAVHGPIEIETPIDRLTCDACKFGIGERFFDLDDAKAALNNTIHQHEGDHDCRCVIVPAKETTKT